MKRLKNHELLSTGSRAFALVLLALLAGCSRETDAKAANAKNSNSAELFSIPQEQMSHVQVLTVQPSTLTRTLRLTGAVAYNSFRTTPVITQVSALIVIFVFILILTH